MDELNKKVDRILEILEDLQCEVRSTKANAEKMSRHIDSVDCYISFFRHKIMGVRNSTAYLEIDDLD